ncbi:MAG: hypothetical protein M3Y48_06695 [Actinomycetota bacterium]|nr:hypothetical protein [Actinomycetota bacterium]
MSAVDWTYGAQHMWVNHKVATVEADEAVGDIDAVWFDPDPASRIRIKPQYSGDRL